MGNYRNVTIHPSESITSAGTKTIPIEGNDIISRILVKWALTKSKHAMDAHASMDITKLEMVDGSDVLFSMTGPEAQALNIYDRKVGSMSAGCHMASVADESWFGLDFGRHLFDPRLALDPARFKNLQLNISYVLTNADSGGAAATLEAFADVFDQKQVIPEGFLMSKELYSYTCGVAGSYEHVELPVDFPIRKLLVRGYTIAYEPEYTITSLRLEEENLKRIPLDLTMAKYLSIMRGVWHEVEELFSVIAYTTARAYYVTPTNYFVSPAGIWTGDEKLTAVSGWPRGGYINIITAGGQNLYGHVHGFCPNHCVEVPFGDQADLADWYDVTQLKKVKLRLEAGTSGTGGKGAVVTQQLRRY